MPLNTDRMYQLWLSPDPDVPELTSEQLEAIATILGPEGVQGSLSSLRLSIERAISEGRDLRPAVAELARAWGLTT